MFSRGYGRGEGVSSWVLKHGRLVKVIEPERLVIRIKKEDMPRKPIKNGLRQRQ